MRHDPLGAGLLLVREGDGVDDEIEPLPAFGKCGEGAVETGFVGHVALDQLAAADAFRERPHAPAERLALEGESQLGTLRAHRLGDAPGERPLVGDAHDEAALSGHERPCFTHPTDYSR